MCYPPRRQVAAPAASGGDAGAWAGGHPDAPPAADDAPDVIAQNGRDDEKEALRPLQVRVPESVFAEFSEGLGAMVT